MFLKTWAGPSGAVNVQKDQPRIEKMTPRQHSRTTKPEPTAVASVQKPTQP